MTSGFIVGNNSEFCAAAWFGLSDTIAVVLNNRAILL